MTGASLPLVGSTVPRVELAEIATPIAAARELWQVLAAERPLVLLALALGAAAAALPYARRKGPWAAAAYGAGMLGACVAAAPHAAAWPLAGAAWILAGLLALDDRLSTRL
jgi:hypothetical protein